ncbi:MAG: hypothetical protein K8R67_11160 [Desulfobacteraceae bacterium]|nr:hypothetical protein [Desulfobacteraceae bacterium]
MSDKIKDDFQQIDISSLENFGEERETRDKDLEPDWNRFKAFYEDLKSEQKETDAFKGLFDLKVEAEKEQSVFEQFGGKKDGIEPDEAVSAIEKEEKVDTETLTQESIADETEKTELVSEGDNDQAGYEKGFEQGLENGQKDGYEKGFEQGEKDGYEKGKKEGHLEGYEKGENKAKEDIDVIISEKSEDFKAMLSKLDNTYQELAHRYEEKIISLICSIAEKVVLAKVEIDEGVVKETVLDALATLPESEDITLSVSDEDYEYIEMVKEDLFDSIKSLKSVSVKSDASVKRGGCRIETKEGTVEADIETKLEKIFASIKGSI